MARRRTEASRDRDMLARVVAGFSAAVERMRSRKGGFEPPFEQPPSDDEPGHRFDDEGLTGSRVPRRPSGLSGSGAAVAVMPDESDEAP